MSIIYCHASFKNCYAGARLSIKKVFENENLSDYTYQRSIDYGAKKVAFQYKRSFPKVLDEQDKTKRIRRLKKMVDYTDLPNNG